MKRFVVSAVVAGLSAAAMAGIKDSDHSPASFKSPVPSVVSNAPGYNAWPMIATVGTNLVCTYSRGAGHGITEGARNAYARVSTDGGATWGAETVVAASPNEGEVMIGKGHAADGAALFWVRCLGKGVYVKRVRAY